MLKKTKVTSTEEKRIVTGMIVSTQFLEQIKPMFKLEYITNSYLNTLALWCDSFFEEYNKAPYMHIKDIFEAEQANMKDTEIELIDNLLTTLEDQYDEESINVKYLVDTGLDYFRGRALEIAVNNVSVLKDSGDYGQAEMVMEDFVKVQNDIDHSVLINPGNLDNWEDIYKRRDEEEKNFFRHPGDLGRYLGNWKRGDVVGYFGPAKRGKSFTLIDNFKQGVLNKRRTLFWSIEMTDTEVMPRIHKSFNPTIDADAGIYNFPAFDCKHNQTGECVDRLSPTVVIDDDTGELIHDPAHITCKKCSGAFDYATRVRYSKVIYRDAMWREPDDIFELRKQYKMYKKMWGKYGRVSCHPKYTLTYDLMMRDVEALFKRDLFVPDIMILDYIDILDINSSFDDYRVEDERWKLLAKVAGSCNCLFITATQANKAGHESTVLDATHQGGFYGKNRHVNLMVGLNQSPQDKEDGVMKFGITEARSIDYIPGITCDVLQDFKTGQSHLDSYYTGTKN